MKDIQSKNQYPSDFNPSKNIKDITQIFESNNFYMGRMISGSKHSYRDEYPNNFVMFNANVLAQTYGKVWHGDLDITLDHKALMKIAEQINEPLYVLYEMDARFGSEDKPIETLIKKAVWNTTQTDIVTRQDLIEKRERDETSR